MDANSEVMAEVALGFHHVHSMDELGEIINVVARSVFPFSTSRVDGQNVARRMSGYGTHNWIRIILSEDHTLDNDYLCCIVLQLPAGRECDYCLLSRRHNCALRPSAHWEVLSQRSAHRYHCARSGSFSSM